MIEQLYEIFQKHPQIVTDSRQIQPGCLFFALKGEKFDGNAFAEKAIESGAAFAIVDNPDLARNSRCIVVPDVLEALQKLATHHRRQFDIPVIGVAGSNGKTTTKELVGAVLSSHYPTCVTRGNLNNHIGVPLTLLSMQPETEVAVIEMGANHIGEVAELCEIAEPTHGLVTNIGKEHLEGFGDLEGVKKAESEIYKYLAAHSGLAFINRDEKYLSTLANANRKKIFYRRSDAPDPKVVGLETKLVAETPFLRVAFLGDDKQLTEVQTQLPGRYNFHNIQTAIALGRYFKVPSAKIKAALEAYTPSNNRSQIVRRGSTTFVMDCYNANPSSMKAALESLRDLPAGRKIAVLGDMLELGAASLAEHRAMFNFAKKCGLEQLVLVGTEFGKVKLGKSVAQWFPDTATAKTWLNTQDLADATVLVKGSRGIRLEGIL